MCLLYHLTLSVCFRKCIYFKLAPRYPIVSHLKKEKEGEEEKGKEEKEGEREGRRGKKKK